ncbi:polyketide synthase [Colletotrichum incanum]|uniref:Polyketide synthase n=1 Tax=Colletotrichum incanum TaxID=1573173 RepID=A0A162PSY5_COLIC|nr:polyketide synthase [Colletotrichum incanum]
MRPSQEHQHWSFPSLLVFGPQAQLSPDDLVELRSLLVSNVWLSRLLTAAQELPNFWFRLVRFDPELARVPGESCLRGLAQWLAHAGSFPYRPSELPVTLAFPLNFLFQMTQYSCLIQSMNEDNTQRAILGRLEDGGVQGFCVGFLCAITVASSWSENELVEIAIRTLRLAVCIGAYVDKDAICSQPACISVRGRHTQAVSQKKAAEILQKFPKAYISAVTDETSMTITTFRHDLPGLKEALRGAGFLVQGVPVDGRFHTAAYVSETDRLVDFFAQASDLRFPESDQLRVPIRSATDGKVINQGNLVRHTLENTLLKRVEWYNTLKLATASLPPGQKCIALAGISTHFPPSLSAKPDMQLVSLRSLTDSQAKMIQDPHVEGLSGHHTPPYTPLGHTYDIGVLSLEDDCDRHPSKSGELVQSTFPSHSVAIVGMAGKFPGASSVDELWELISTGQSTVNSAPDRVGLNQLPDDTPQVRWWGNFLDEHDTFDHKFFNKSAREAMACDPQQRKLLEVVYEALESSGYHGADARSDPTDYGCYIGAVMNNYATNISCHPPTAYAMMGTSRAYLSGAVSHHFGWTGPAMTIDTACSSSLVAIHTACRAIAAGDCSRAIAGGTNIITCPYDYRDLKAAGFLSPTGQCKPFDAGADGYCRGEAVCVVVLKSLSAAIEEKDHVLGVIVGSATNQNPKEGPIVVPNAKAQAGLLREVMNMSKVSPEDITYVEAHGTGTSVGDPIEVQSLREAFGGQSRTSELYFSSIKGNIGHSEAASGAAGLAKAILMMRHRQIPPQASYQSLNPKIPALEPDGMAIPQKLTSWNPPERIACVNNYGAAGSNSVVVIREAPLVEIKRTDPSINTTQSSSWPLILSASSKTSLSAYGRKLLDWVQYTKSANLSDFYVQDILFNLAHRANHALEYLVSASVSDISDLELTLSAVASGGNSITTAPSPPQPVVLVFGGQEGRFVGLSEAVYKSSRILRHHLDTCQNILLDLGLEGFYPAIFQKAPVSELIVLHTALFAVQYSCAKAWMDCGLRVAAVIGHSFGQLTALCISGVLSLSDALKLVAGRASLVEKHWGSEPGAMIALQADRQKVAETIERVGSQAGYVEIACLNGPRSHVVVGSSEAIRRLEDFVTGKKQPQGSICSQRLEVTHGFHSRFTEAILPHLADLADGLEWKSPTIHLEVCSEKQNDQTPDRSLIVEHTRRPVYFQQAVERLMKKYPQATWLEAGRGLSATHLVRACAQHPNHHSFLAPQLTTPNAQDSLVDVTVRLWRNGHAVQYWPFHRAQRWQYQYLSLPPYQFQRTRHWLPYVRSAAGSGGSASAQPKDAEHHQFVSLINGDKSTEACFRISTRSNRFRALVDGHIMCGYALMPASAYIEVTSRAALTLQGDLQAAIWTPTVEDLVMQAPIAVGPEQSPPDITMTMRRLKNPWPSWSFSITVNPDLENDQGSVQGNETTTGSVQLHQRTEPQIARELKRFDSLVGNHRWEQIMSHQDAEGMHGKHIYRAFSQVVEYSEAFRGIKTIARLGSEAAGTVRIFPNSEDPPDQRLTDTPMVDSFMQFGGFLVNYFNEKTSSDSLFVCHRVQRVQVGPTFTPDSHEWSILANMTAVDQGNLSADVYVSETRSKKIVFTALGMDFTKMSRASFKRIVSGPMRDVDSLRVVTCTRTEPDAIEELITQATQKPNGNVLSRRTEILRITASIADIPESELSGDTTLADIGIDSLGATEMISDITSALNVTIDLATFLLFPDINSIVDHVDSQLGLQPGTQYDAVISSSAEDTKGLGDLRGLENGTVPMSSGEAPAVKKGTVFKRDHEFKSDGSILPTITSILKSFDDVRLNFDKLGAATHALDYWSEIYPDDVRLILAYTTDALGTLGCDLRALGPGEIVPEVLGVLPRHRQLMRRLYRFLEDEDIIEASSNEVFTRTNKTIEATPGEQIFQDIIGKHPLNAAIRHLLQAVGPHLAACLVGDKDALQILFGNRSNKKWLEDLYLDWPMLVTATQLLGDFLCHALTENHGSEPRPGPFRILEIGAGTGGTTRHIVDLLTKRGIHFEYHFTDISASLVQKARTSFADVDSMSFGVLDIEQEPTPELTQAFHVIISTNCIHATRNIACSLANMRKMLREDGALALIEMTAPRPLYVFDLIVGLLEGWWLFEDGRSHALADVKRWEQAFAEAGFREVLWSDGATLEAKTVRVICGFQNSGTLRSRTETTKKQGGPNDVRIQEVIYKMAGSQKIYADIYCPLNANPIKKMPIALMIHGGSHIIFSRKDVRPPQTRIMLDMGLLPVSLDHRLCPETRLVDGPMVDVCDAVEWARKKLPHIELENPDIRPDPNNIVVVGWSSGGQLALSTGWTTVERGIRPPNAILAFYCPTDYESDWWQMPIQPLGAEDRGEEYNVLDGVQDEPITNYGIIGAWEPLSDPRIRTDSRSRIILHMNWKAQTLPIIIEGLPSKRRAASERPDVEDWNVLPQPLVEEIRRCSPLAQVRSGNYATPTFMVHGTADDLIPWQQSLRTVEEMKTHGIDARLVLVPEGPHICDASHDAESAGWQAVLEAYQWLGNHAFPSFS